MNSILITGCSTGFGLEIARRFLAEGWRVVATMRNPADSKLEPSPNLLVLPLDVTDPTSIASAIADAGEIDVLVNNAGIGWMSALEATSLDRVRRLFETNVFGMIATMQAVLPQMRARKAGVIVNVSSSVTLQSYPLLSVYSATKGAVNKLTTSAALELKDLGIRVHGVLPGAAPDTSFADSTLDIVSGEAGSIEAYREQTTALLQAFEQIGQTGNITHSTDVAEVVWEVVNDPQSPTLRPAGADALALFED